MSAESEGDLTDVPAAAAKEPDEDGITVQTEYSIGIAGGAEAAADAADLRSN